MRDFWNRIGGPDAFNWVSLLLVYPVVVGSNIVGSGVDVASEGLAVVLFSTIAMGAILVLLLLAKYTVLRGARHRPMPIRTVLVVIVALLLRAWVFDALLLASKLATEERVFYRFTASFASIGISFIFAAYLVSLARDYSRSSRDLRLTRDALVNTRTDVDGRIAAKRDALIANIRGQLTDRLSNFKTESAGETLAELRATIEDVVRPVSHDLDRQVADIGGSTPVTRDDRILWSRVLKNSTLGQPIRPLMFSIWSGISALFFAPRLWGFWEGVAVAATVFVVPFLLLVVIRRFWKRVASHRSAGSRALIFTGSLFVLGIISATTAGFVSGLYERFIPMIIPQTVLWSLSGWVVAVLPSLRQELARVLRELKLATAELREELVRVNTAYRLQQKAIARALHGPIQDAMSVSAFKLAAAMESGTATPELIAELRDMIAETLVLLEKHDDASPHLEHALEDMAELWEGVVEIAWTITPEAATVIRDHEITAASATELVREAVSNSVRHGQASVVQIEVSMNEDRLTLRVENNGSFEVDKKKKQGLGTTLLEELTLSWSRVYEHEKTVLTAVLPVI